MTRPVAFAVASLLALTTGACAAGTDSGAGDGDRPHAVAAFYPLEFVTAQVGGDGVAVTTLAPPGVEAHDLELTPSQVAEITGADLVVYLSGFQPAVDEAVARHAEGAVLDVAEVVPLLDAPEEHDHADEDDHADEGGHEHAAVDPHVWLDPDRLATIADEVAGRLGSLDPDHAADYTAGATALGGELAALDTAYADGLADCERREIVVSHAAFGYLTDRYDLRQIAVAGLSPEQEPTPQRLAEVVEQADDHGATTIFFEVLVSPAVAEVIADHTGAGTAVLDPIEGLAPDSDDDYLSLMRANLEALRAALGCAA